MYLLCPVVYFRNGTAPMLGFLTCTPCTQWHCTYVVFPGLRARQGASAFDWAWRGPPTQQSKAALLSFWQMTPWQG